MKGKNPEAGESLRFEKWFDDLKSHAITELGFALQAAETIDAEDFRASFNEGLTPIEAWSEELSYGD